MTGACRTSESHVGKQPQRPSGMRIENRFDRVPLVEIGSIIPAGRIWRRSLPAGVFFYDDTDLRRALVHGAKPLCQIAREFVGCFSGSWNFAE